jgi:adenylyltransferase/sulfurtransferase
MKDISAQEFNKLKNDFIVLDVREKLEYHTFNIGGLNIPLGRLPQLIEDNELEIDTDIYIVVVCQRGLRSKTAKLILQNAGYKNVSNLIGGINMLQRIA